MIQKPKLKKYLLIPEDEFFTLAEDAGRSLLDDYTAVCLEEPDPIKKITEEMNHYLSDYNCSPQALIVRLRGELKRNPDKMLDDVSGIVVWGKVENQFTVEEFCDLVGIEPIKILE